MRVLSLLLHFYLFICFFSTSLLFWSSPNESRLLLLLRLNLICLFCYSFNSSLPFTVFLLQLFFIVVECHEKIVFKCKENSSFFTTRTRIHSFIYTKNTNIDNNDVFFSTLRTPCLSHSIFMCLCVCVFLFAFIIFTNFFAPIWLYHFACQIFFWLCSTRT